MLSPCLFNLCVEYIMRNTRLDEAQDEIKISKINVHNLRYTDDTTSGRKWRGTEEPFDESEKRRVKKFA